MTAKYNMGSGPEKEGQNWKKKKKVCKSVNSIASVLISWFQ